NRRYLHSFPTRRSSDLKGFMDSIAGKFDIDWSKEDLNRVTKTITKRYNAEIHSQSSIEGLLELKDAENIAADDIKEIRLYTFDVDRKSTRLNSSHVSIS